MELDIRRSHTYFYGVVGRHTSNFINFEAQGSSLPHRRLQYMSMVQLGHEKPLKKKNNNISAAARVARYIPGHIVSAVLVS